MWERIVASSLLIIGAVIFFAVFTATLFVIERKENKKAKRKVQPMRVTHSSKKAA